MTYTLFIWTVVAMAGTGTSAYTTIEKDWRPLAEFNSLYHRDEPNKAQELCEAAARQLGLKPQLYRCVRTK